MVRFRLILAVGAITLLAACGRKGALIPPEALVPAAVQDFSVQQSGEYFRLTWSAPTKEKGGRPLRDLSGFKLFKRIISGDGTDCSACSDSWKLLSDIDAENPAKAVKSGSTFIFNDKQAADAKGEQYRIVALSKSGGVSPPSLSPVKKSYQPFPAPLINGVVIPGAIRLELTPPLNVVPVGYNIYKRSKKESVAPLPFNASPITGKGLDDRQLEYGKAYRYSATALVEKNGDIVESVKSAEVELIFVLPELR